MKNTQGQEANQSGRLLEDEIEHQFRSRNVLISSHSQVKGNRDLFTSRVLVKNVPQRNWHRTTSRSEFVYYSATHSITRIECKWQEHQGSVDEKAPAFLLNAELAPEFNVWLIIGGCGFRPSIMRWIDQRCRDLAENKKKFVRLLTPDTAKRAIKILIDDGNPGSPLCDGPYIIDPRSRPRRNTIVVPEITLPLWAK